MIFLPKLGLLVSAGAVLFMRAHAQAFPVPSITPAQQVAAQVAVVQLAQSDAGKNNLTSDVANAAAVAVGIAQNFTTIGTQLQTIDNMNLQPQKFFPQWQIFRNTYLTLLQTAKNQASAIAGYADEFNAGILQIVTNDGIDNDTKIAVLDSFIAQSTTFQNGSNFLAIEFATLGSNLTEFTGNFANFARNRTAGDNATINDLLQQIGNLQSEVSKIETSMVALGIAMGSALLGSAALLVVLPEFAPGIVIAAAIAEGILAVTEIGLVTAIGVDNNKIGSLQNQVQELQNDISLINGVQGQLNNTATNQIPIMTAHLSMFTQVWQDVADDCTKLIGWLQEGANSTNQPIVLAVWLNQSTTIYDSMSAALTQYATSVAII
ncbi:hypothetical protein FA95DRAFT_1604676 [Auriscalpium vulgare]|uniref:Uncharacterized protein n=1 Tax=Auriscalpium vulgare TaxID=40419 RepID=A0ACB8RZ78_9AGAM|nr:hypothetical protein FA95DRAFT_1604676 [Auriscalpium vulgare]